MTDSKKVDTYINKHTKWSKELSSIRSVFQQTELNEEIKWGVPTYTLQGSLVAGLGAFKNHYAIWFHQGVFLKDTNKKLINAQEGITKALRQWKFSADDRIEKKLILSYIIEAMENAKAGKKIKPQPKKKLKLPELLKEAIKNNDSLAIQFNKLTPGKQREYADHISEAKREATKQSRLEKSIFMILDGKGLYDKYKNC